MKLTTLVHSEVASLALQWLKGHMAFSHIYVLLASHFCELWGSVMSICLLTEVVYWLR